MKCFENSTMATRQCSHTCLHFALCRPAEAAPALAAHWVCNGMRTLVTGLLPNLLLIAVPVRRNKYVLNFMQIIAKCPAHGHQATTLCPSLMTDTRERGHLASISCLHACTKDRKPFCSSPGRGA